MNKKPKEKSNRFLKRSTYEKKLLKLIKAKENAWSYWRKFIMTFFIFNFIFWFDFFD